MVEEYINKREFLEDIQYIEETLKDFGHEFTKEDILKYLKEKMPVLKIVRCKNCAYRNTKECAFSFGEYEWTTDNSFCKFGKEKEDE